MWAFYEILKAKGSKQRQISKTEEEKQQLTRVQIFNSAIQPAYWLANTVFSHVLQGEGSRNYDTGVTVFYKRWQNISEWLYLEHINGVLKYNVVKKLFSSCFWLVREMSYLSRGNKMSLSVIQSLRTGSHQQTLDESNADYNLCSPFFHDNWNEYNSIYIFIIHAVVMMLPLQTDIFWLMAPPSWILVSLCRCCCFFDDTHTLKMSRKRTLLFFPPTSSEKTDESYFALRGSNFAKFNTNLCFKTAARFLHHRQLSSTHFNRSF